MLRCTESDMLSCTGCDGGHVQGLKGRSNISNISLLSNSLLFLNLNSSSSYSLVFNKLMGV